jgi:hypothetical protein
MAGMATMGLVTSRLAPLNRMNAGIESPKRRGCNFGALCLLSSHISHRYSADMTSRGMLIGPQANTGPHNLTRQ